MGWVNAAERETMRQMIGGSPGTFPAYQARMQLLQEISELPDWVNQTLQMLKEQLAAMAEAIDEEDEE
jgi:hypothetical protein